MIGKLRSTLFVAAIGLALSVGGAVTQIPQAQADTFDINTCFTGGCGGGNVTVATLDIVQNGANVDFTLTNSVANLGGFADGDTFISFLHFTYTGNTLTNTDFSAPTVGSIETGPGAPPAPDGFPPLQNINDAALDFNLNLDLPPPGSTFTQGEVINWTVSNDVVANFTSGLNTDPNSQVFLMVHVQALNVPSGQEDSAKYVNGPNIPVPEPATLLLLGAGLAGIGIWRRVSGKI